MKTDLDREELLIASHLAILSNIELLASTMTILRHSGCLTGLRKEPLVIRPVDSLCYFSSKNWERTPTVATEVDKQQAIYCL